MKFSFIKANRVMKRGILRKAVLMALCLALYACAGKSARLHEDYVGVVPGQHSNIFYRVENGELLLAFENSTTLTMQNLVIVVEQTTESGSNEIQSNMGTLRMRQVREMAFKIPYKATGTVIVTSYFLLTPAATVNMGPGTVSESEPAMDIVKFRIPIY